MHHPTDMIVYVTAYIPQFVDHWMEQEVAQWVHQAEWFDDPPRRDRRSSTELHLAGSCSGGVMCRI